MTLTGLERKLPQLINHEPLRTYVVSRGAGEDAGDSEMSDEHRVLGGQNP